jgi:tripartite-type tricarboxylate transporter receptor subunit TctC
MKKFVLAASAAVISVCFEAAAQGFPSRPVTIVVPFPAGGVVDILARSIADRMSAGLGQPVIVDARPGADSVIGTEAMLKAPADGHTILMASPNIVTHEFMSPAPRWTFARDIAGIAYVADVPNVAVVSAMLGPTTLREFVELVKKQPGKLNYASPGNGTSNHLGTELFLQVTGTDLVKVAYKGQPPAVPDLLNNTVQFKLLTMSLAVPHVTSGKLRALAVAATRRTKALPDVPTFAEAGYPDVKVVPFFGLVARKGVPRETIARLNEEVRKALAQAEVTGRIEKANGEAATPASAEEFERFLASESQKFGPLIKSRGIKSE